MQTTGEVTTPFYDVFVSYRHRDAAQVTQLASKIRELGYTVFIDAEIPELGDTANVPPKKIEDLRSYLSHATCLILAYSRSSSQQGGAGDVPVGAWMPWELGFFDGSVSGRIGVYLFDDEDEAAPDKFDGKTYFRGSEYLQVYERITGVNLPAFLKRYAARERRIDNVAGAFTWMHNLAEETVCNPVNVMLGVAEWHADHIANYWRKLGNEVWADYFGAMKIRLDDLRVDWSPALRLRLPEIPVHAGNPLSSGLPQAIPYWNFDAPGEFTEARARSRGNGLLTDI